MIASLTFDDERNPSPVNIDQDLTLVGSGGKADVVIEDSNISPLHCAIINTRGGWRVLDLYSRQGTRVNDQPVADRILETGDRIMLGKKSAIFEMTEDAPSAEGDAIQLEDGSGVWWSLESDAALIGSWGGCDIVVENAEPTHMIVVNSHRGAVVRTICEKSLIIVNGRQTDECSLQDGDVIQVGGDRFTVQAPHLPKRSDRGQMKGGRVHIQCRAPCDSIEEQKQISQLLDAVAQVPDEIRQVREEIGQQLGSLTHGMQSSADAFAEKVRQVSDREAEHMSQIQVIGNRFEEHGGILRELMDRLACVVDATESSRVATESAVDKLNADRKWLSTELDSRDKTLQKVWEGLIQVRKTMASSNAEAPVGELCEQVETLNAQFVDLRSELPQQLADAIKGLTRADRRGLAALVKQRAGLAEQEQRLAEERKTLEDTRRQVTSKREESLRELADAEQQHQQRKADLDQQERLLTERSLQLDLLRQKAAQEHRSRELSLQGERQRLRTLKIEVELREAHSKDRASKLIRLCQRIARLDGSREGADASSQLIAFAKNIAVKIEKPGRIITSASKNIAAEPLLHPSPSSDASGLSSPFPVGSSPNSC